MTYVLVFVFLAAGKLLHYNDLWAIGVTNGLARWWDGMNTLAEHAIATAGLLSSVKCEALLNSLSVGLGEVDLKLVVCRASYA